MADKNTNPETDDFDTGVDVNSLSDAEKAIYERLNKQVREAYLKKTSTLADQRRAWEAEKAELAKQHAEAASALTQWQTWWEQEGKFLSPREAREAADDLGLENPNALVKELNTLKGQFAQAAQRYDQVIEQLGSQNKMLENALRLQNELTDLRIAHMEYDPETKTVKSTVDPMRVLNTAKERGLTSLELAYKLAYDDELRTKDVDTKVAAREKELRSQIEAERDLVQTSTPSTTRYAPPKEAASYSEASKGLLDAVKKSGGGTMLTD